MVGCAFVRQIAIVLLVIGISVPVDSNGAETITAQDLDYACAVLSSVMMGVAKDAKSEDNMFAITVFLWDGLVPETGRRSGNNSFLTR